MEKILIFLNKNYWNIIYILYIINKLIEFPLIITTYIIFIYIYIKNKKIKNKFKKILLLIIISLLSLIIKKIIKKIIFIKRPYFNILNNIKKNKIKKKYYKIPIWLKNNWKNKKDSSFPSGHTVFSIFWITSFKKKKIKYINFINNILKIIILSRLLLYLHRLEDIIFSLVINYIIKNIIFIIFWK